MTNAAKLKTWIDDHGVKLSWLARRCDVSRVTASRWANGHVVPRPKQRVALAEITDGQVERAGWLADEPEAPCAP